MIMRVFALILSFSLFALPSAWAAKSTLKKAPPLPKNAVWFNLKERQQPPAFKGKVTVLEFWDYASVHSIRDIDNLKKWRALYGPMGFQVIGIHSPDFDFSFKKDNVKNAVKRLGVYYPILMDNDFKVWKQYRVFFWPTRFVVGRDGSITYMNRGEGKYRETEEEIRKALIRGNPKLKLPALVSEKEIFNYFDSTFCGEMSDEFRIGTGDKDSMRVPAIANPEGFSPGKVVMYKDQGGHPPKMYFAHGPWRNFEDHFEHARSTEEPEDYLGVAFEGYEIYGVLSSSHIEPVRFYVLMDSKPLAFRERGRDILTDERGKTYVLVDEPRLYYLAQEIKAGPHELKLYTQDEGASVYSLSFGNRCLTQFEKL